MSAPHQTTNSQDTRQQATVQPSSRDPIERWLDVFTGLLAVSAKQRERIRDELEDHLRMRVEDLLILGESEPEAVQRAVKELGETAELAKRFKEATHHPRRSTIMHSILLAVAGTGLAVGAVTLTGSPAAMPLTAPVGVVQPAQDEIKTLGVDLPAGPLEQALSTVAEVTGAPMFVHWAPIENELGVDRESEVGFIPAKNLSGSKILELINASLGLEGADVLDVRVEEGLVEVATRGYFDRLETVTLDHDISAITPYARILEVTQEAANLQRSIVSIIEPSVWAENGGPASIAITGAQLSVRAPKRVQAEVEQYIQRLARSAQESQHHLEALQRQAREEENAARLRNAEQMVQRRRELEDRVLELRDRVESINREYWELEYLAKDFELQYEAAESLQAREELRAQLVAAKARHGSAEFDRDMLFEEFRVMQNQLREVDKHLSTLAP